MRNLTAPYVLCSQIIINWHIIWGTNGQIQSAEGEVGEEEGEKYLQGFLSNKTYPLLNWTVICHLNEANDSGFTIYLNNLSS